MYYILTFLPKFLPTTNEWKNFSTILLYFNLIKSKFKKLNLNLNKHALFYSKNDTAIVSRGIDNRDTRTIIKTTLVTKHGFFLKQ